MTVAEGGGRRAVARKFQDVYLPALKANFMLWPAVQILNFRAIPLQFQIVSSSSFRYLEWVESLILALLALRFHHRNCLDSVSVTDQLSRRGLKNHDSLEPHAILNSSVPLSMYYNTEHGAFVQRRGVYIVASFIGGCSVLRRFVLCW